jgi:hypothetical protein
LSTRWSAEELPANERCWHSTHRRQFGCGCSDQLVRAVRRALSPKRKRKIAGRKIAPLISMRAVAPLSDTELQPFLDRLPSRSENSSVRNKLDWLMSTYLGILEAEAASPSAREVAMALERIAQGTHEIARYLYTLDFRLDSEELGGFNTANEAAADILARISIREENRSVLEAALRANDILAAVAAGEAKKLAESSNKGRLTHGQATAWMLQRLIELLGEHGLRVAARPKSGDSVCVLSRHFLQVALTRATALSGSESATHEIKYALNLSDRVFRGRLRQAAEIVSEG